MAAPWFTLFRAIPWSDVISHAPGVAKEARRLWDKVATRKAAPLPAGPGAAASSPEERLAFLETRLAEADARQQESAELLATLALQNAELVRATDALRRRVRLLGLGVGALLIAVVGAYFR